MEPAPEKKISAEAIGESAVQPAPAPSVLQPNIPTLRTYRDDIVQAVKRGATLATVAAAETERRAAGEKTAGETGEESPEERKTKKFLALGSAGILLLALLAGGIAWLYSNEKRSREPVGVLRPANFISVEGSMPLPADRLDRDKLAALLLSNVRGTVLTLGSMEQYYLTIEEEDAPKLVSAQAFLSQLGTEAPDFLARTFEPLFFFGVHVFNGNQPFLIFKTVSYENAFAGMLAWESTLQKDLSPVFGAALTRADLQPLATSTEAILPSASFEDKVLRNKDTRVFRNRGGEIVLLYSFVDHNTLVITTNEYTFAEVISRLGAARLP